MNRENMNDIDIPDAVLEKMKLLGNRVSLIQEHPVFSSIESMDDLREFMEWHVFAVWDFMSLIKRLQNEFTCTNVPWLPSKNNLAARLINEIVLGEETDESGKGKYCSHFELYLDAMKEVEASTSKIKQFIDLLNCGINVNDALNITGVPIKLSEFVRGTIETALNSSIPCVFGNFFYGREHIIPGMFKGLLEHWNISPKTAPTFVYYLERHIKLDADSHGPAAMLIIKEVLQKNVIEWNDLIDSAIAAVNRRISLWDALEQRIKERKVEVM